MAAHDAHKRANVASRLENAASPHHRQHFPISGRRDRFAA